MAFVCYVLLKDANVHINCICFDRNCDHPQITAVSFVPRKQSKKPRFYFHRNIICVEKVFEMYLLLGLSLLFGHLNSRSFWKKIVAFAVLLKKLTIKISCLTALV